MAMALYDPCYISGWTAAQHWELTEQIFSSVLVYSAKPERRSSQQLGGVSYRIRRVPKDAICGITRMWSGTVAVQMATVHRTVIDVLDAPEMGGGGRQTLDIVRAYWQRADADPEALLELATRLNRGSVFKRLGFTAERFGAPGDPWLERCRARLSAGIALLDPTGPKRGTIISRWRIRINVPLDVEANREGEMSKSAMVRARVEAHLKERAEAMLDEMGLSATTAITLFYRQIIQRRGLPFEVRLPNAATRRAMQAARSGSGVVAADSMDELLEKLGDDKAARSAKRKARSAR